MSRWYDRAQAHYKADHPTTREGWIAKTKRDAERNAVQEYVLRFTSWWGQFKDLCKILFFGVLILLFLFACVVIPGFWKIIPFAIMIYIFAK